MIKIYSAPSNSALVDLTDANSIVSGHNRRAFIPDRKKLYLRNDDNTKWMSNISLSATSSGVDVTSGANGFGFKFFWGDVNPTHRVWQSIGYNVPININNIGTSGAGNGDTTFFPFWMQVEVSPDTDVSLYEAKLLVSFVEHSVT
tara:strand:- start:366 stop:800 length:435 start_codon:yes stop_codon:yes gene_type:complete